MDLLYIIYALFMDYLMSYYVLFYTHKIFILIDMYIFLCNTEGEQINSFLCPMFGFRKVKENDQEHCKMIYSLKFVHFFKYKEQL